MYSGQWRSQLGFIHICHLHIYRKLILLHTLLPSFLESHQVCRNLMCAFLGNVSFVKGQLEPPLLGCFLHNEEPLNVHMGYTLVKPAGGEPDNPRPKFSVCVCAECVSGVQPLDKEEVNTLYKTGKKRFMALTVFHYWKIDMLKSSKNQCKRINSQCTSRACFFQESGGKGSFISCFIKFHFEEKQTAKAYV